MIAFPIGKQTLNTLSLAGFAINLWMMKLKSISIQTPEFTFSNTKVSFFWKLSDKIGVYITLHISSYQLTHGTGFDNKPNTVVTLQFTTMGWNAHILETVIPDAKAYWESHRPKDNTLIKQSCPWWPQGKVCFLPFHSQLDRPS